MNFGGLRGGGSQGAAASPAVQAASQEMDMVTTLFNNIVDTCHAKCVMPDSYHDSEIHKGEAVCIDRCVAKYFDVNVRVGKMLSARAQENAAAGGAAAATAAASTVAPSA